MIGCLIGFLVAVLVCIIVLRAIEVGLSALGVSFPANVMMVVRVILVLILLLMALNCLFGSGGVPGLGTFWRCP